jgi:O-antigen ligase
MNYLARERSGITFRIGRFPWPTFLFLAVVFFLCQHDLYYSTKVTETFNPSEDELIVALDAGSLSRRVALLALVLFAMASLHRHRGAPLRINGSLGRILLSYAGWAALSLTWAEDPALTFRRLAVLATLGLAAAAIARRFSLREIILLTFFCSVVFLFIGISAEIALGTFRPFTLGYRFAGTLHPNHQGINCALLLLSGVAAAHTEKRRRTVFRACALLGLVFLILTASRTAFASALLALAAYAATVSSRRAKTVLGLGLGIAFLGLLMVDGNLLLPQLKSAAMLGRDESTLDSFSGRTGIWREVGDYIRQRPALGYGYGGFWTERHIKRTSSTLRWGAAEAHSAYLECLLDLGLVGLAAYVFALLGGIARSFALYRASQTHAFAFCGAFLVFCVVNGLLESATVLSIILIFLIIAVLVHLGFRRPAIEYRRRTATIHKETGDRLQETYARAAAQLEGVNVR